MQSIKQLLQDVNTEENRVYTSIALFLAVISIFVVFAIRPVLVIAFELVQKEKELTEKNTEYEQVISQITTIQTALQEVESQLSVLTEAMPERPAINTVINDIQKTAAANNISITKMSGGDISLIKSAKGTQSYVLEVQSVGEFKNIFAFQKSLYNQRRLKGIQKIDIVKNEQAASGSAGLNFAIEIVGYYL